MAKKPIKKKTKTKKVLKKDPRICPECGKIHPVRKDLGIGATRDEVDSLMMINNRINVAAQAAQPTNIAPNVTKEQIKIFVEAALEAKAEAMSLQRQWWQEILAKYTALPKNKNIFVDFETCAFYIMEQPE